MPHKIQIAKTFWHVSGKISWYTKMILIFYHMTQKISGLLKTFRIAMLPCYRGFSLSGPMMDPADLTRCDPAW